MGVGSHLKSSVSKIEELHVNLEKEYARSCLEVISDDYKLKNLFISMSYGINDICINADLEILSICSYKCANPCCMVRLILHISKPLQLKKLHLYCGCDDSLSAGNFKVTKEKTRTLVSELKSGTGTEPETGIVKSTELIDIKQWNIEELSCGVDPRDHENIEFLHKMNPMLLYVPSLEYWGYEEHVQTLIKNPKLTRLRLIILADKIILL